LRPTALPDRDRVSHLVERDVRALVAAAADGRPHLPFSGRDRAPTGDDPGVETLSVLEDDHGVAFTV